MISYQNHETYQDETIVKALIRNQLKICSKLHFVNMIYKHLPVWNRSDVIPYLKITGIAVNPNLGSGEVFALEKLELITNKKAATFYVQMPLKLYLRRKWLFYFGYLAAAAAITRSFAMNMLYLLYS